MVSELEVGKKYTDSTNTFTVLSFEGKNLEVVVVSILEDDHGYKGVDGEYRFFYKPFCRIVHLKE